MRHWRFEAPSGPRAGMRRTLTLPGLGKGVKIISLSVALFFDVLSDAEDLCQSEDMGEPPRVT